MYIYIYFFLAAFSAAFVTVHSHVSTRSMILVYCNSPLPPLSVFSTDLMTPTATVCLMSRTAKRPSGGYSEYDSTHIGLLGTSLTMQASPDLTNLGACSMALPVRRSIFSRSSANLQAMWAVWQSRTGAYPAPI